MRRYGLIILGALGAVAVAVWLLVANAPEIRRAFFPEPPAPAPAASPQTPKLRVLVASRAIEPGKVLELADIVWAELPSDAIPMERIVAPGATPSRGATPAPAGTSAQRPANGTAATPATPPRREEAAAPASEAPVSEPRLEGEEAPASEEAAAEAPETPRTPEAVRRSYVGRRIATYVPARAVISPRMFDESLMRGRDRGPQTEADQAFGTGPMAYANPRGDGTAPLAPRPVLLRVARVFVVVATESLAGTRWIEVEKVLDRAPVVSRDGVEGLDLSVEQRDLVNRASRRGELWVVDGAWRPEDSPRRLCLGERCLIPEATLKESTRQPEPPAPAAPAATAAVPAATPATPIAAANGATGRNGAPPTRAPGATGLPNLDRVVGDRTPAPRPAPRPSPPIPPSPATGAPTR